ncbi:MAG TPA: permease-like cell division protein FtsX [Bacillota bacterium]|nr:permease-like cell division protein FtsX [Bacillota bacterium]
MKNTLYNIGYFLKEARTIILLNPLSNAFSLLSAVLIFFILAIVISGWCISNQVVAAIQEEAEINVYFKGDPGNIDAIKLTEGIKGIAGVREARLVGEDEAYGRMEKILGKESRVLEFFNENPFSPFIEVNINIEGMEHIIKELSRMEGIEHVRDNREVLERLWGISEALEILGYLILIAVGITTIVIIAHIIRMGIYDNREQINTLRLMGAPEIFIAFPYLLEGLIITLAGSVIASALVVSALKYLYTQIGPLPFIPLPPRESLTVNLIALIMSLGAVLGISGSFFGISSAKRG